MRGGTTGTGMGKGDESGGRESGAAEQPLVIACGIFRRELDALLESGEIDAEAIYLGSFLHLDYGKLESALVAVLQREKGRRPVVLYGDVCMGFGEEIRPLVEAHEAVKVDGLNCIDCLLGGRGKLLEVDPEHEFLFLTPGWIRFFERYVAENPEARKRQFSVLKGIVLVDALGDRSAYRDRIRAVSEQTGLPVVDEKEVGMEPFREVIREALDRARGKSG